MHDVDTKTGLSIGEAADATGLSTHTLRYYERDGLMAPVGREGNGHRLYSESDLGWIEVLTKLRCTGMPIRRMRQYAELAFAGDHTAADRLALLEAHRDTVRADVMELENSLAFIQRKIDVYKGKAATC